MNDPALSIVLAVAHDAADRDASLSSALSAVAQSVNGLAAGLAYEVIVVTGDARALPHMPPLLLPHTRVVVAAHGTLTPVMWGLGLQAARGRVVAFTTSHMQVSATWAGALIDAIHRGVDAGVVGAGGPIALRARPSRVTDDAAADAAADAVADATTLVRFNAFLSGRWLHVTTAHDIPGDNAAYLRAHLVEHADLLRDGFWEVEFHRRFARAGKQLLMVPAAAATAQGTVDLHTFRAHRYAHAVSFGMSRVSRHGHSAFRIVLLAPCVPVVLLARIARRAQAAGIDRGRLRRALPTVLRLTIAWAAGEAVGAYRAASRRRRARPSGNVHA